MAVQVDLVAKGNIASEANKAADAMDQLAKKEERVQQVAKSLGTTDIKQVGKALDMVAKAEAKALAKQESAERKAHNREIKYARQDLKGLGVSLEMQDKLLQKLGPDTAAALATGAELALGVGAALAIGAAAATALGVAISKAAIETGAARDSAAALMGVLTNGQGTKTLKLVDGLAEQLGVKFQDARDDFIKFRQAGLDNTMSANLIKLKADLDAVDKSGKLSAEAVSKVLAHKGGAGTAEEMALLAKQAGVLGNGALAAEKRFSSLGGALNSLDNSKTVALQQIFDRISPSIDKVAGKVAMMVDEFINSEKGIKLIDGIGAAIEKVADLAGQSLPYVAEGLDLVLTAGQKVADAISWVSDVFKNNAAASAAASAAFTGLKVIAGALAVAVGVVIAAGIALVAPLYAAVAAVTVLVGAFATGLKALWDFAGSVPKIGSAIIDGLIGGIMSKVASLKATVGNIASTVSGGFKSALGIASPSKLFAKYGKYTGQGYEQGLDKSMPTGDEIASNVVPSGASAAPVASAGAASAGGGSAAPSGPLVWIENLNVPVGVEPEPFARAIRREVSLMLQILQLAKGEPA